MNAFPIGARFRNEGEEALWRDLRQRIGEVIRAYSGNDDPDRVTRIANDWFNDREDRNGRWAAVAARLPQEGRILDMAAGCGTFLLFGLQQGRDAWGVEPEPWKRQYYASKIIASGYPPEFGPRLVAGFGERLPFPDRHFDLVTSYQTLEHVASVPDCLKEMLRVLRPGGYLYIRAPDYNGFYEPHYGVPLWPKMNKTLAAFYLKLLGRPLAALRELNWISEREIIRQIRSLPFKTEIARSGDGSAARPGNRLMHAIKNSLRRLRTLLREEKQIDLWVTRIE